MHSNSSKANNYRKKEIIGKGSFGKVYRVVRKRDGKEFAMKVLQFKNLRNIEEKKSVVNELDLMKRLAHPNVINCVDQFDYGNYKCIVMPLCNGDMESFIKKVRSTPEHRVMHWFVQMVLGVHYMHQEGVMHRDVKAQNMFRIGTKRLLMGDLGISKANDFSRTAIGTPYYMSPEIIKGMKYTSKCDVWALGCTLFELVERGRKPFDARTLPELQRAIVTLNPRPIPRGYSSGLRKLYRKMLEKKPEMRPSLEQVLKTDIMADAVGRFFADMIDRDESQTLGGTMMYQSAAKKLSGLDISNSIKGNRSLNNLLKQIKKLGLEDRATTHVNVKQNLNAVTAGTLKLDKLSVKERVKLRNHAEFEYQLNVAKQDDMKQEMETLAHKLGAMRDKNAKKVNKLRRPPNTAGEGGLRGRNRLKVKDVKSNMKYKKHRAYDRHGRRKQPSSDIDLERKEVEKLNAWQNKNDGYESRYKGNRDDIEESNRLKKDAMVQNARERRREREKHRLQRKEFQEMEERKRVEAEKRAREDRLWARRRMVDEQRVALEREQEELKRKEIEREKELQLKRERRRLEAERIERENREKRRQHQLELMEERRLAAAREAERERVAAKERREQQKEYIFKQRERDAVARADARKRRELNENKKLYLRKLGEEKSTYIKNHDDHQLLHRHSYSKDDKSSTSSRSKPVVKNVFPDSENSTSSLSPSESNSFGEKSDTKEFPTYFNNRPNNLNLPKAKGRSLRKSISDASPMKSTSGYISRERILLRKQHEAAQKEKDYIAKAEQIRRDNLNSRNKAKEMNSNLYRSSDDVVIPMYPPGIAVEVIANEVSPIEVLDAMEYALPPSRFGKFKDELSPIESSPSTDIQNHFNDRNGVVYGDEGASNGESDSTSDTGSDSETGGDSSEIDKKLCQLKEAFEMTVLRNNYLAPLLSDSKKVDKMDDSDDSDDYSSEDEEEEIGDGSNYIDASDSITQRYDTMLMEIREIIGNDEITYLMIDVMKQELSRAFPRSDLEERVLKYWQAHNPDIPTKYANEVLSKMRVLILMRLNSGDII